MKIFITGSNGFIGGHLVNKALAKGHEVVGFRLPGHLEKIKIPKQPIWLEGSLEDDLKTTLNGCDVLIHLAAYGVNPSYNSWEEAFRWNVYASLNLWKQAYEVGIKRLIISGSCSEYGRSAERYENIPSDAPLEPINAYGASKAAASIAALAYAREYNMEVAILRPFHIYGEGEGLTRFFPAIKRAALEGKDFPMTLGQQIRDFTPVDMVAEKFLEYSTEVSIEPGKPIIKNLGTGNPQSLIDFAKNLWNIYDAKGKLLPGSISYRKNEIMRCVPKI